MIRKKKNVFLTFIIILCVIWTVFFTRYNKLFRSVKLNSLSRQYVRYSYATINHFKAFYRLSIIEDHKNINGRLGKGVKTISSEKEEHDRRFNLHKFNEMASSKIPLLREIPEKRRSSCFSRKYPYHLPNASIIIIYHNEAFSTLLRTVHTALSRAPFYLITDIILVDDFSDYITFPHLLKPLDDHFKNNSKVKIIRSKERIGLTVARLRGAKEATGEVLVFLDSHCEAADGWLEPLLADIKKYPKFAITPLIKVISYTDFSIKSGNNYKISVGLFNWKGDFTWYSPEKQDSSSNVIRSPTMAGGLFAIRKKYFFEIGGYDDQMTYWGSENLEISFRVAKI